MNYPDTFRNLVETHLNSYVGLGNPASEIIIIGKEVATDVKSGTNKVLEKQNLANYTRNAIDWEKNIQKNVRIKDIKDWIFNDPNLLNNPLFAFKGAEIKKEGQTWRKYQKLHDLIFPKNICKTKYGHNFQERIFITEMSELNSKQSKKAQKRKEFNEELRIRKQDFFSHKFFKTFPVVVLACSNYIYGDEIEKIFNVKFAEQKGKGKQLYWTHFNDNKLVIHTRQLSSNVENILLSEMAADIKEFLGK